MSEVQIKFNSEGFRQILLGDGVRQVVQDATDRIANTANANLTDPGSDGFEGDVVESPRMSGYGNGGRWVGFVRSVDAGAAEDEAENKVLSRAVL